MKGNKAYFKPGSAWITSTELEGSLADILVNRIYGFLKQLKTGNRWNRVVLKNTSEKYFEDALHVVQKIANMVE